MQLENELQHTCNDIMSADILATISRKIVDRFIIRDCSVYFRASLLYLYLQKCKARAK